MDVAGSRDRLRRDERLDEERLHLFTLEQMVDALRGEPEYDANGHTGMTLIKTAHLRVVLEAARAGVVIDEHTIPTPTVIQVLEGALHVTSEEETRIVHAGEMVVIPHDRERSLRAEEDVAFVWALSWDEDIRSPD